MEMLDGQSLERLLRASGPLDVERALPLLAQLSAALDYAHGMDVG
jgi:hypothetical protein